MSMEPNKPEAGERRGDRERRDVVERPARGPVAWWHNTRGFLTEVRNEMRRVTWPTRREVYATTVVVILTASFFGLYLWGLDLAIDAAVTWVYGRFA